MTVIAEHKRERQRRLQAETDEARGIAAKLQREGAEDYVQQATDAELDGLVALVQSQVDRLTQIYADTGQGQTPEGQQARATLPSEFTKLGQKEKACRADAKCMTERRLTPVVAAICSDLAEIQGAKAQIARERSNPGGVVDMEVLHSAGESIQQHTDDLKANQATYLKITHKPFGEALCRKVPANGAQ